MVAITVILAAVIGTFVLGLGDSLGDSQPTAQLSAEIDYADSAADNITIEHGGGDEIAADSLNVIVSSGSDSADGIIGQRLTVGDSTTAALSSSDSNEVASESEIRIRIIHQPSESVLLDRTFQVSQQTDLQSDYTLSFT
ncbi:type IV pilin [Halorubrum yunnanense]